MPNAVILLSGGLDSATVAAMARRDGFTLFALSIDYGQRHRLELDAARDVAQSLSVMRHVVVPLDLRVFGGSALTADIDVPKERDATAIGQGIPSTYVPARNTIFLSLALAYAEVSDAADIFIGANALDYSGYPDCRPEFVEAFERVANLGTKAGVEGERRLTIHAPLMRLDKAGIIHAGVGLGMDYGLTLSCYDPAPPNLACGSCDSCQLRRKGFAEAGVPDPTRYRVHT